MVSFPEDLCSLHQNWSLGTDTGLLGHGKQRSEQANEFHQEVPVVPSYYSSCSKAIAAYDFRAYMSLGALSGSTFVLKAAVLNLCSHNGWSALGSPPFYSKSAI